MTSEKDVSEQKLLAWIRTCFDEPLICQVFSFFRQATKQSRVIIFKRIARVQVQAKAIPMFEEMGGSEGLLRYLGTSLDSGISSSEVKSC